MSMLPTSTRRSDGGGGLTGLLAPPVSAPTSTTGSNRTQTDITNLLLGTGNQTTRGTNDITSIVTGGLFNGTDSRTVQSGDVIKSIYDFLGGNTLQSQLEAQRNALLNQHGVTQGYEGLARQTLNSDANLAQRGLNIDRAGLGVQQGAASRDLGAIAELLGINDQSLQRTLGSVNQLLGINDQGLERTLDTVAQLLGLNRASLSNQVAGINLSEGINNRGLRDDSVARGAYNAPGTRQGFSDIEREAELARAAANISSRQTSVGLEDRAGEARESHAVSRIGLSDRAGSAGEEHARTRIGLNRQAGDANDTLRRLDLEAQRLNLSGEQIRATLDQGLQRLGLESLTNANDLITRLNGANVEQATMAANLLAQAAQLAGLEGIADIVGGGGGTGGTGTNSGTTTRRR